jgi:glucokinase
MHRLNKRIRKQLLINGTLNSMAEGVLAIDIGGTNIKAGLVDRDGTVTGMIHCPSRAAEGREALLGVLETVVLEQCTHHTVLAVGAGSPGTVNHRDGTIAYMQAHMPGWTGTPLSDHLAGWTGVPTVIDNDVNCIALGEYWKGAGRGYRCQVSLALGTGLGGGLVIDGRLFHGAAGNASEFGHMVVRPGGEPCTCGNFGCAEVYTAPGAMVRRARYYLETGIPSALAGMEQFSSKDIVTCAAEGDRLCLKLIDDAACCLALLIWNLVQAYDPDVFVIGGGFMNAGDVFLIPLRKELAGYYRSPDLPSSYTIKVSELGDNAGILGAARLAWDVLGDAVHRH